MSATTGIGKWFWESMSGKSARERTITCPKCNGKGEYENYASYIRTGHSFTSPCGKCRQTGRVTEYYWDWDA
jgi:DnaJ-class molecular chaperone